MATDLFCCERLQPDLRKTEKDPVIFNDVRVINNLLCLEKQYVPSCDYFSMVQMDIKPFMRKVVSTWMLEVRRLTLKLKLSRVKLKWPADYGITPFICQKQNRQDGQQARKFNRFPVCEALSRTGFQFLFAVKINSVVINFSWRLFNPLSNAGVEKFQFHSKRRNWKKNSICSTSNWEFLVSIHKKCKTRSISTLILSLTKACRCFIVYKN